MKRSFIITILISFITLVHINSQNIDLENAEWIYSDFNNILNKYVPVYYNVSGEKEINGKLCKIIEKKDYHNNLKYNEYWYQDSSKVFFYNEWLDTFLLLFDFSAKVNDTLNIGINYAFIENDTPYVKIIIDSILYESYCDTILKTWYVNTLNNDLKYTFDNKVIETIGFLNYFHPRYGLDESAEGNLRCFSNSEVSCNFFSFDCDAFVESLNTDQTYLLNIFQIYPNPSSTKINVELSKENNVSKWNMFDIQGNKILSGTRENIKKIDISTLKSGLYYLQVIDNKGRSVVGKFVVE